MGETGLRVRYGTCGEQAGRRAVAGPAVAALLLVSALSAAAAVPGAALLSDMAPSLALADDAATYDEPTYGSVSVCMEEGCGVLRALTPYYTAFLTADMFPGSFAYEYFDTLAQAELTPAAAAAGVSVYGVLDVYSFDFQPGTEAIEAMPTCRMYCTSDDYEGVPFEGDYVVEQVASTRETDGGYAVYVAVYCGSDSGRTADEARSLASSLAAMMSNDTFSSLARTGSSALVTTTLYRVEIPDTLFPGGWYYVYRDGLDSSGARGYTLDVVPVGENEPAFSVTCTSGGSADDGSTATQTAAQLGGAWEGWEVVVNTSEANTSQLATYAACVSASE